MMILFIFLILLSCLYFLLDYLLRIYKFTPLNIYNGTPEGVLLEIQGQQFPINELNGMPPLAACPISNLHRCKEGFNYSKNINNSNTYNADMPLTNIYNCQNFCSPTSRCAITGQQCFSDMDCPGCNMDKILYPEIPMIHEEVPGTDDSKKLSNLGIQYSRL
jgi:hypothetical protein